MLNLKRIIITTVVLAFGILLKADPIIDSLLIEYDKTDDKTEKFDILTELINQYTPVNSDSARVFLDKAEKLIIFADSDLKLAEFYKNKGAFLSSIYLKDSAILYLKKSENLFYSLKYKPGIINSSLLLATTYFSVFNSDSAIFYYNIVLNLTDSTENPWAYAAYLNNIANVHYRENNNVKALNYYLRSLNIFKLTENKKDIAILKNNISQIYHDLLNYDRAIEYAYEASKLNLEVNNVDELIGNYNTLSLIYKDIKLYDSAKYYIFKALKISYDASFDYYRAQSYHNLGTIYLRTDEFDSAEFNFAKSLEISTDLGIEAGKLYNLSNLGEVYIRKKNFRKAEKYLDDAMFLADSVLKISDVKSEILSLYSLLYSEWGQHQKALGYYEKYHQLKDSLVRVKDLNKLKEIQARYESEQKELENQNLKIQNKNQEFVILRQRVTVILSIISALIAILVVIMMISIRRRRKQRLLLLEEKNKKIEEQSEELTILNNTKDKLFSIISHDLRSPFTALMGLATILEQELREKKYGDALRFAEQLNQATKSTYELIDNLLNWSRSQQNKIIVSKAQIDLNKIVEKLYLSVEPLIKEKSISFNINIPENTVIYTDKNILSVIIRNLLSNAIKFTDDGGNIVLSAQMKNDNILISVKDNGIGMSKDIKSRLEETTDMFSSMGTANEEGTGLGLLLVKEFLSRLDSKLIIESTPNKGSIFSFELNSRK